MTIITCMLLFILCMVIEFTKQNIERSNVQMMQQLASGPLESLTSSYDLSDGAFLDALLDASHRMPQNTGFLPEYNLRYMRISTPADQFMIFVDVTNEITTIHNLTRTCIAIGIFSFLYSSESAFCWRTGLSGRSTKHGYSRNSLSRTLPTS